MANVMITTPAVDGDVVEKTLRNGDVVVWFEFVGPERAKQLLATYKIDYRKFRPTYGDGLSEDMLQDHWNFDGSPIRIDADGNLFDGQHRLYAVVKSEKGQWFLFIAGLPVSAYNTTDTGLARTYGDLLRLRGYTMVSARQALIKLISRHERGISYDDSKRLTNAQMDEVADKHISGINRAIELTMTISRKIAVPQSVISFAAWRLQQIDPAASKEFLVGLAEGENLRKGHPIYTLRERLIADHEMRRTRGEYIHFLFQTWNAWREDRELFRNSLPPGVMTRDKIVEPR